MVLKVPAQPGTYFKERVVNTREREYFQAKFFGSNPNGLFQRF
jgi:hypothetical protein